MSIVNVRMLAYQARRCFADACDREPQVIDIADGHGLKKILDSAAVDAGAKDYVYGTSE